MSNGAQIGGVIGAAIGGYFGGPQGAQIGFTIGSTIGGYIDPAQVFGPKLRDAAVQTAMDGVPRTYGYGTFPTAGNLLWTSALTERKRTESSKGSPTETITYHYFRSYAIGVCRAPEDGLGIAGYRIIKRNGKVVYDTRTDDELTELGYNTNQIAETRAAQSKFNERVTLYYGVKDQNPDPTIQAIKGALDVPGYSYTAYIVVTDDDLTDLRGAIPQYEFVVSVCGDRTDVPAVIGTVRWDPETHSGGTLAYGDDFTSVTGQSNTPGTVLADTAVMAGEWYWETTTGWILVGGSGINHFGWSGIMRTGDGTYALAIANSEGGSDGYAFSSNDDLLFDPVLLYPNWVPPPNVSRTARLRNWLSIVDGAATWLVAVDGGPWIVVMPGVPGEFVPFALSRGSIQDGGTSAKRVQIFSRPEDFLYEIPDGLLPLGAAVGVPAGFVPIPDSPGYWVNPITGEIYGPAGTSISQCAPTLAEIVQDQCALREVESVDVSELDDSVLGFRIANVSSPQKNVAALMPSYFFDASEYDGVIHFPKRGRADSFSFSIDDLVKREGDPIEWERIQEPELLRKVTVGYFDPMTTYTPTTQQWERRAGTVKAQGEGTIELPLVASREIAAQAADMNGKVAWAEGDLCKFSLSIAEADLVPSAVGTIEDENGTIHRIRVEKISDSGLIRSVEGRRTAAHVYQSYAEGAQKPLPTFPGSDVRGPTQFAIMNMPAILDSQDRVGVYWAASGVMSGWVGAQLEINRAGAWSVIGIMESPSGMGVLVNDVSAHEGDWDTVNTLILRINQEVSSVTYEQLLSERNPIAIVYPDFSVEVVQFQNVEIDSNGDFVCTELIRGRLDTVRGPHDAGASVVILDNSIQFVDLRPTDLGTTAQMRVVSLGTNPDSAPTVIVPLARIWSSTEWPIDSLEIERDGDDFHLSWLRRDRLGTDVMPIRSSNWDGYSVRWQFGDQTGVETTSTESLSTTITGASNVTFSVSQINRLTGEGPETIMVVP